MDPLTSFVCSEQLEGVPASALVVVVPLSESDFFGLHARSAAKTTGTAASTKTASFRIGASVHRLFAAEVARVKRLAFSARHARVLDFVEAARIARLTDDVAIARVTRAARRTSVAADR